MVTLYMLDAVDIKIDIIDINRYLKYIIDINDINIGIYFGHEWGTRAPGRVDIRQLKGRASPTNLDDTTHKPIYEGYCVEK